MIRRLVYIILAIGMSQTISAQDENLTWKGNKAYRDMDYTGAQEKYEQSLQKAPSNDTRYNLANSLYKQQKYKEAAGMYKSLAEQSKDPKEKARAYHNLGNSLLKAKEIDPGIEAYKQALRNNPTDEETRYNLSYAMRLKQQQEEQEKNDQNKDQEDQEQDQNKDQQQQDQEQKQDQNKNEDQQKQDQQEQQQNQDQQDQKQDEQQQQQQPKENELSKEDAVRMLENAENEEEKTREKLQLQKRKAVKKKLDNDW